MSNIQKLRDQDVEKDFGLPTNGNDDRNSYHLDVGEENDSALRKIRTAGSISISPELFEKIYLSPKNRVSGDVRSRFGNPTPLCIGGFLLSLTPLSNILLGWRGSGGSGAAEVGAFYFFGGMLMTVGSILEFILGNTFPFVVFGTFGAFWLTYASTLTPYFAAATTYQPDDPTTAATNPQFLASYAFFLLYMGLLCLFYLICAIRTNIVFCGIFATLVAAFGSLAGSFWQSAQGNTVLGLKLQHAGGGLTFATCLLGWYLFVVQMLAAVDFPLNLPVGDLSRFVRGASDRKKTEKAN